MIDKLTTTPDVDGMFIYFRLNLLAMYARAKIWHSKLNCNLGLRNDEFELDLWHL